MGSSILTIGILMTGLSLAWIIKEIAFSSFINKNLDEGPFPWFSLITTFTGIFIIIHWYFGIGR